MSDLAEAAHPASFDADAAVRTISRPALALLISAALAANFIFDKFINPAERAASFSGSFIGAIASFNLFQVFAWYVAWTLLAKADRNVTASPVDMAFAFLLAAATIVANISGDRMIFGMLASAAAIYCFASSANDRNMRAAGTIFCAIAANAIWGPLLFSFSAMEFLRADSYLVGAVLAAFHPEISWSNFVISSPGQHSIILVDGCSSFHNMTLAILCWISMTMLQRQVWRRMDILVGLSACLAMYLMNATRIVKMALGQQEYHYWHDGAGAELFGLSVTITIAAICFAGVKLTGDKQ